jgi:hypothetical protein
MLHLQCRAHTLGADPESGVRLRALIGCQPSSNNLGGMRQPCESDAGFRAHQTQLRAYAVAVELIDYERPYAPSS